MAGQGRKTFSDGEVLSAADVNGYLMDQSVMRFADSTARTAAIGTPTEGMVSYLDDTNDVEVYDGSGWVNFTGDITNITAGTALTGGGSEGAVTLDVDIAAVSTAVTITQAQVSDVTATASEINILDGATVTTAELNILDGVTADATEVNVLDGITATTAELNFVDGVTSAIQSQIDGLQTDIDAKAPLTPTVNSRSSGFTLSSGDRGEFFTLNGTFTVTIPSGTFSAGDRVDFINIGTGTITFSGSGVTINSVDAFTTIDTQYAAATFVFTSSSEGVLIGRLA